MAEALKVRGLCKCGKVINQTAPKGRTTWRGPCPSCGAQVIARRMRTETPAAAPAEPEASQTRPARGRAPQPIVKVDGYDRQQQAQPDARVRGAAGDDGSPIGPGGQLVDNEHESDVPAAGDGAAGGHAGPEPLPAVGPARTRRPAKAVPRPRKPHPYGHVIGAFGD